jgi:hypothetical protein
MSAQARISYYLSEQGRLASLRQGGHCRRLQETIGVVDESDLAAFSINDEGLVSFDATVAFYPREVTVPAGTGRMVKTSTGGEEMEWDVMPTWEDLVAIARQVKGIARQDQSRCRRRRETAGSHRSGFPRSPRRPGYNRRPRLCRYRRSKV